MKDKTIFELAQRFNEIIVERNKLDLEHNMIVTELKDRLPHLKDCEDFELIIKEGDKNDNRNKRKVYINR